MQLRDQITRPARFDDDEVASHVWRRRPPDCTTPAYPGMLQSIARPWSPALAPATSPSLDLDATCAEKLSNQASQYSSAPSAAAATRTSTLQHQSTAQSISASPSSEDEMDIDFDHDGYASSFVTAPPRSPVQAIQSRSETVVRWHHLSDAIKLWIFDSIASFAPSQEVVGQRLGLSHVELDMIISESKKRKAHPHTMEEILAFRAGEGSIGSDTWKEYEDYIAYAAKFEEATELEIRLGVLFLRQQNVSDHIARALSADLTEEPVIDPGMLHIDHDSFATASDSAQFSGMMDRDWRTSAGIDVQTQNRSSMSSSHDLASTASHFRSCYFPRHDRDRLMSKDKKTMSFIQTWFVYGTVDIGESVRPDTVPDLLRRCRNNILRVGHPVLQCLLVLLNRILQSSSFHTTVRTSQLAAGSLVDVWIYTTCRYVTLSRMIRTAVHSYDLKDWEKQRIVLAACQEALRSIQVDVKARLGQDSVDQHWPQPALPSSDAVTLLNVDATERTHACVETPHQPVVKVGVRERRGILDLSPIHTTSFSSSSSPLYSSRTGTPFLTIDKHGHASISEHSSDLDDSLSSSKRRRVSLHQSGIPSTPVSAATTAQPPHLICQSTWVDGPALDVGVSDDAESNYVDVMDYSDIPSRRMRTSPWSSALAPYPCVADDLMAQLQDTCVLPTSPHTQTRLGVQGPVLQTNPWFSPATLLPSQQEQSGSNEVRTELTSVGLPSVIANDKSTTALPVLQDNTSLAANDTFVPFASTGQVHYRPVIDDNSGTKVYGKPVVHKRVYVRRSRPAPLQTGTPWIPNSILKSRNEDFGERSGAYGVATKAQLSS